jgi:outer membrane biosynthesis protein TonB
MQQLSLLAPQFVRPLPPGEQLGGGEPESPPLLEPELLPERAPPPDEEEPELPPELPPLEPPPEPPPEPAPLPETDPLEEEDGASMAPPSAFPALLEPLPQLAATLTCGQAGEHKDCSMRVDRFPHLTRATSSDQAVKRWRRRARSGSGDR